MFVMYQNHDTRILPCSMTMREFQHVLAHDVMRKVVSKDTSLVRKKNK
jgi:hypothetical protein